MQQEQSDNLRVGNVSLIIPVPNIVSDDELLEETGRSYIRNH